MKKEWENSEIRDILVGDTWILAGQSNMEGGGHLERALNAHPMVRALFMDDRWDTAKTPIHNIEAVVDQVHIDINTEKGPLRCFHEHRCIKSAK